MFLTASCQLPPSLSLSPNAQASALRTSALPERLSLSLYPSPSPSITVRPVQDGLFASSHPHPHPHELNLRSVLKALIRPTSRSRSRSRSKPAVAGTGAILLARRVVRLEGGESGVREGPIDVAVILLVIDAMVVGRTVLLALCGSEFLVPD